MSPLNDTVSPMSYQTWLAAQDTLEPTLATLKYKDYLIEWYRTEGRKNAVLGDDLKGQYLQLVKDLSFLFGQNEKDQFLANIDYDNEDELIYAIPFFARKLKEIAIVLSRKREAVKEAKLRYNLVGSNNGLEKLLYEYLLRGFTNTENSITQVPASSLISLFPDLSAVKTEFSIEVEELHDPNSYFDSDPSVSISEYVDVVDLNSNPVFEDMTEDEITGILSTRYLPKIAPTPLSNLFNAYVNAGTETEGDFLLINNEIEAFQKYTSQPLYGLTALKLKDVYRPDANLTMTLEEGNTWFMWPSGDRVLNNLAFLNTFEPLDVNEANFVSSGATMGSSFDTSDLLFVENNSTVHGAWLNGVLPTTEKTTMQITLERQAYREFLFPFVGFNLTPKGNQFESYSFQDTIFQGTFNKLDETTRRELMSEYYTQSLPASASLPLYLNQTNLVYDGAYANSFSENSDLIIKKKKTGSLLSSYSDTIDGKAEVAYLYKPQRTNLAIRDGITNIYWPFITYTETDTIPLTIKNDTCLPIDLKNINPQKHMVGAVAGTSFIDADVIYKMSTKSKDPMEAAWLGSLDFNDLDFYNNSIQVYPTSAVRCSQYLEGPVQSSLSFKAEPNEFISFVWGDVDTYADDVFHFVEHASNCPYGKEGHDYYQDQDYRNRTPLFNKTHWTTCSCKSLNFSPIGHIGEAALEYDMMCDFIFHDTDGEGADFNISTWQDTRALRYDESPQFAHYKINGSTGDSPVGWGAGSWKTGDGSPLVLKTGKRYTYKRSSFRKTKSGDNNSPFLVVNYAYKDISGYIFPNSPMDLVLAVDISKSQTFDLETVKEILIKTTDLLFKVTTQKIQIALLVFGTNASVITTLNTKKADLDFMINTIAVPPLDADSATDIASALSLIDSLFTVGDTDANVLNLRDLCSRLKYVITTNSRAETVVNSPNPNAKKKVLFFTNGVESFNVGMALPLAQELKNSGVEFYVADIGEQGASSISPKLASSPAKYFNLRDYLNMGDTTAGEFADYISYRLNDLVSIAPRWNKMVRDVNGNWIGTSDASDMVLSPGDYLTYVHQSGTRYQSENGVADFTTPSISFDFSTKLNGWDYSMSHFALSATDAMDGAKPFWGTVYTLPTSDKFNKETDYLGGNPRYVDGYLRITQPEISPMVLNSGDFIRYKRQANENFTWNEPLTFTVTLSPMMWKKLYLDKKLSNLSDLVKTNPYEYVLEVSHEPSDIVFESYTSFNPVYYNYYARKKFDYTQDLFYRNRDLNSFVTYNTAVAISPVEPYANLLNVFYPTVAMVSIPSQSVTKKQVGEYMLPDKLGATSYLGKGYTIEIDNDSLAKIDSLSAERMFLPLEKYGPRQRSTTKKDQITPVKISSIDNTWVYESYDAGYRAGMIIETRGSQKFTPYQTTYEIEGENKYGISRTTDIFEFWEPREGSIWTDEKGYPLTFRKEVLPEVYDRRVEKLIVNQGTMVNWRTDIFGYDYGLYKA